MPALLVGLGILAVGALVVFFPGGDDPTPVRATSPEPGTRAGGDGAVRGGIPRRAVDKAEHGARADAPRPRINKALRHMPTGMSETVPDRGPPESFDSPAEERAWYENALQRAKADLQVREKALTRLEKSRGKIEQAKDPAQARANYERQRAIVERNLQHAREQVAEIERKLAELDGATP